MVHDTARDDKLVAQYNEIRKEISVFRKEFTEDQTQLSKEVVGGNTKPRNETSSLMSQVAEVKGTVDAMLSLMRERKP